MTYRRLYGCPHGALGLSTHTWARAAQAEEDHFPRDRDLAWPGPGPILRSRRRLLASSACTECSGPGQASAWADVCAQGMCEARIPGQDTPDQAQPWLDPESWSWPMRGQCPGHVICLDQSQGSASGSGHARASSRPRRPQVVNLYFQVRIFTTCTLNISTFLNSYFH